MSQWALRSRPAPPETNNKHTNPTETSKKHTNLPVKSTRSAKLLEMANQNNGLKRKKISSPPKNTSVAKRLRQRGNDAKPATTKAKAKSAIEQTTTSKVREPATSSPAKEPTITPSSEFCRNVHGTVYGVRL